jgi:3-deoxy-D-manno-octulosonic-acid transferase
MYRAALWPAAAGAAAWMMATPARRPLLGRFRPVLPAGVGERPVWVHACSVGEVTTALPMVRAMQARWPGRALLLTVSTQTGLELARDRSPVPVCWFPLDHPLSVSHFFKGLRPSALVLVETELWPGVLAHAHATGVPVAVVSGRLSDARAQSYRRSAWIWRPVLRPLAAAAMQSQVFAERMAGLGVNPTRICVTGNIKYDAAEPALSAGDRAALRAALGVKAGVPVVVFGSTREGDEALAAECWRQLRDRFPALRIIVAPRHLDRLEDARRALGDVPHVLRSGLVAGTESAASVILLDTHGELRRVYAIADVAVACGSFYTGVGGHNPLEPAAQGVGTVFGPHMANFLDIATELSAHGGAVQVSSPEALAQALARLLDDPAERVRLGSAALDVVRANQGAIGRTLDFVAPAIGLPL